MLSTFKFTNSSQAADTSSWKTYTNSKYGFSLKYPKTGDVQEASCYGEASCPKHTGACGVYITEDYKSNPAEVSFDNFFMISVEPYSGRIEDYLKEKKMEGKYVTNTVVVTGADEAIKITGPKPGAVFKEYPQGDPLSQASYLIKKGNNLYSVKGFQAVGNNGCLPEVSDMKPANGMPSWDIPASISFTQ